MSNLRIGVSDLGIRVSDLGIRVSDLGIRVSDLGIRAGAAVNCGGVLASAGATGQDKPL